MPILNYTTSIDFYKSIGEIQKILGNHGIVKQSLFYFQNTPVGLEFSVILHERELSFRLPCRIQQVHKLLKSAKIPSKFQTEEQATRVAWRIVKDWVEAQMAMVESELVKIEEIFLPYVIVDDGDTLFERVKSKQFLLKSNN